MTRTIPGTSGWFHPSGYFLSERYFNAILNRPTGLMLQYPTERNTRWQGRGQKRLKRSKSWKPSVVRAKDMISFLGG